MSKPTFEQLVAYVTGEISAEESLGIEREAAVSADTAAAIARLRSIIQTMRTDDTVAPSPRAVAAAIAIHARNFVPQPSWLERLARSVGELVFDSRRQPALVGLRGDDETVQLSFSSALADVDLQLDPASPESTNVNIMGQVSAHAASAATEVALVEPRAGVAVGVATPDESGVFRLQARPGAYDLVVRLDDAAIVLPNIEIG